MKEVLVYEVVGERSTELPCFSFAMHKPVT